MKQLTKNKIFSLIVTLFLSILIIFSGVYPTYVRADDLTNNYTSVMEDLAKDTSFDINDYPIKSDDYSLQIFQVAESSSNELFLYVYNPSFTTKPLLATTVRLSSAINNSFHPLDYKLFLKTIKELIYIFYK